MVTADAVRVTPADLPGVPGGPGVAVGRGGPPSVLAANLPYNVAVPVVLHLLATVPSLARGLVMVQAEVADRMTAAPGSRIYGVPSVKLAWFASARRAGVVPRTVFWPVPNVDSGLVAFTRRPPPEPDVPREKVFAVVDAAFGQRRKTLRAALARWAGGPDVAEEICAVRAWIRVPEERRLPWRSRPDRRVHRASRRFRGLTPRAGPGLARGCPAGTPHGRRVVLNVPVAVAEAPLWAMSNHTSPSVLYRRIPRNRLPILANWPASGATAVSDSNMGLSVNTRTWAMVRPKTLVNVSDDRK